jgi:hypothetical protein
VALTSWGMLSWRPRILKRIVVIALASATVIRMASITMRRSGLRIFFSRGMKPDSRQG